MRLDTHRTCCVLTVLAFAAAGSARAQTDGPQTGHRKMIDKRISQMRNALGKGSSVRTNVRVKVTLRNGNKIQGVVRNGLFIERVSGLDFVPAEMATPGAGLRIWYYDNTTSYIFLPYAAIKRYKIGSRLTNVEVQEIERRILKAKEEADRRRAAIKEARRKALEAEQAKKDKAAKKDQGENGGAGDPDKGPAQEIDVEKAAEERRLLALLKEFPAEDGWGPDKLREIQVRKVTVGAFPDAKSRRFIEIFKDWEKGKKIADARAKAAEGDKAEPAPTTGGSKPTSRKY